MLVVITHLLITTRTGSGLTALARPSDTPVSVVAAVFVSSLLWLVISYKNPEHFLEETMSILKLFNRFLLHFPFRRKIKNKAKKERVGTLLGLLGKKLLCFPNSERKKTE